MKNKIEFKKAIILSILSIILIATVFYFISAYQYRVYTNNFNIKLGMIFANMEENYPNVDKNELMKIMNGKTDSKQDLFKEYGIDLKSDSVIMQNEQLFVKFTITNLCLIIGLSFMILIIFIRYNCSKDKKLKEITRYIEEINHKNYKLDIENNTEDELSILKNEIYKTTVMLKEAAENSVKDKVNLKDSLSDISHQLKTPLTSIRIMLDNILENPEMEKDVREEFLRDISNQIEWISSLVISLLKIAKFDAGTIKMENEEINVKKLIDNVVSNLSILLEIKEVEVVTDIDENSTFVADYKWQLEALTNIIKNAIEYSNQGSKIYIKTENNAVFLKIKIQDTGKGIEKKDIKHIFERFYKTKNNHEESIGIGLSLAKTIIEQNNGYIKVDSEIGKGTTFEIKYLK